MNNEQHGLKRLCLESASSPEGVCDMFKILMTVLWSGLCDLVFSAGGWCQFWGAMKQV